MQLVKVTEANYDLFFDLVQSYEDEFSAITEKEPDEHGHYALDTQIGDNVMGFICYANENPAGIIAVADKGNRHYEVCEFYIVPDFRKQSLGVKFAHTVWELFPGFWEIKQIAGAEYATLFWRKAIKAFRQTAFEETRYDDPYWGAVTRQQFEVIEPMPDKVPASGLSSIRQCGSLAVIPVHKTV